MTVAKSDGVSAEVLRPWRVERENGELIAGSFTTIDDALVARAWVERYLAPETFWIRRAAGKAVRLPMGRTPEQVRRHVLLAITNAHKSIEAANGRRPLRFSDRYLMAEYLMNEIPELGLIELGREDSVTREFCDHCGNVNAVGFTVPDPIWRQVASSDTTLCLGCFARRADDLNLEWDKDIQFWPVSKVTLEAH